MVQSQFLIVYCLNNSHLIFYDCVINTCFICQILPQPKNYIFSNGLLLFLVLLINEVLVNLPNGITIYCDISLFQNLMGFFWINFKLPMVLFHPHILLCFPVTNLINKNVNGLFLSLTIIFPFLANNLLYSLLVKNV